MDYIEVLSMNELKEEKKKVVEKELEVYIEVVKKLKSKFWVSLWGLYVACINVKLSLNHW
jgi:F0F1-type ATP synthase beta subunit